MQPVKERSSTSPSPSSSSSPKNANRQPIVIRRDFRDSFAPLMDSSTSPGRCVATVRGPQNLTAQILPRTQGNRATDSSRPFRAIQTPGQNTGPWPNAPGLNQRSSEIPPLEGEESTTWHLPPSLPRRSPPYTP